MQAKVCWGLIFYVFGCGITFQFFHVIFESAVNIDFFILCIQFLSISKRQHSFLARGGGQDQEDCRKVCMKCIIASHFISYTQIVVQVFAAFLKGVSLCHKRLESEKTDLISEVNKLHKEGEVWTLQKSELEMTLAELSAENSQLRDELQTKV